jgi:CheY-like chemotaxis protein
MLALQKRLKAVMAVNGRTEFKCLDCDLLDPLQTGALKSAKSSARCAEAIAILEARPDIHVVFTDIQMPGSMDGLKLARFVRGRSPPIKIVATSGFVNVAKDDLEGSRFLTKPYRPSTNHRDASRIDRCRVIRR